MKNYTCNRYYGDIYGRTATVTVTKKLASMPYAQAGVIERADGSVLLISYCTPAACIDADGNLTVFCLCSNTTRRHVSRFLQEYAPNVSYYTAKQLYNSGDAMNIYTGVITPAA